MGVRSFSRFSIFRLGVATTSARLRFALLSLFRPRLKGSPVFCSWKRSILNLGVQMEVADVNLVISDDRRRHVEMAEGGGADAIRSSKKPREPAKRELCYVTTRERGRKREQD